MSKTVFSWRQWWQRLQQRLLSWRQLPALYLNLFADPRVPARARLFLLLGLAYLFVPLDGDWLLLVGWLDDLLALWFSLYLFRANCPPQVVQEHLNRLREAAQPLLQPTDSNGDER